MSLTGHALLLCSHAIGCRDVGNARGGEINPESAEVLALSYSRHGQASLSQLL